MTQNALCIVMARGGSKRVPRKNIRPFCGRPMVEWPIRAALESGVFSSVIMSTEDAEIARVAEACGASIPFLRPAHLADDFSTTADVLLHALQRLRQSSGTLPQYCCCLYGTSALVTPQFLRKGLEQLSTRRCELVMAVAEYAHPIERSLQFSDDGTVFYRQPEFVSVRTQDIKPSYHDLGLFYWFSTEAFLREGGTSFLPLSKSAIVVPRSVAVDIDTEEDWAFAELVARSQGLC
ncbi:pseudaminic acid cytidylyltransferase [Desulfovibrio mangrovi]|uniref:pseudaminic acid cytidylyltransferase n=1 Tax=Desulfovibrio mangrovi TaxID=2976983 RepID=UPI0030846A74